MNFKLQSIGKGLSGFFSLYSLPLLSGCLMGVSYIPFPPYALFFCYVPLWLFALKHRRWQTILTGAWLYQLIGTFIGFNWVDHSIQETGLLPWPLSLLGFFLFCGFANLHIPLALLFWFISQKQLKKIKNPVVHSVLIPLLLPVYSALGFEYYPMIFDWHFGYTWLYAKWPAVQTAEIWGFQFLNTLTLFFNLLFLMAFQNLKKESRTDSSLFKNKLRFRPVPQISKLFQSTVPLILGILFFTGLNFYGQYLKNRWPEPDKKVSVLIVQPNIENDMQKKEEWNDFVLSKLLQETTKTFWTNSSIEKNESTKTETQEQTREQKKPIKKTGLKETKAQNISEESSTGQSDFSTAESVTQERLSLPADFILWPEGAYPYPINKIKAEKGVDPVQKWVSVFNTPLVVSAEGTGQKNTNSVFVFDQNGRLKAFYDKTLLVPFGEYVPFEKWFPFLGRLVFEDETFQSGTGENKVIALKGVKLGFQICYESLSDRHSRRLAHERADILINVTNDAYFGDWQEPWQHLYMTSARAIETRTPLIRGTNSGISALISAKGDISGPYTLNKSMSWMEEVPYYSQENKKRSLFVLWGYYINQFLLWMILFGVHIFSGIAFYFPIKTTTLKK